MRRPQGEGAADTPPGRPLPVVRVAVVVALAAVLVVTGWLIPTRVLELRW